MNIALSRKKPSGIIALLIICCVLFLIGKCADPSDETSKSPDGISATQSITQDISKAPSDFSSTQSIAATSEISSAQSLADTSKATSDVSSAQSLADTSKATSDVSSAQSLADTSELTSDTSSTQNVSQDTSETALFPCDLPESAGKTFSLASVPPFSGSPYVVINDNYPYFIRSDATLEPFENYSSLDSLGRCGAAFANVCIQLMPTQERGSIGAVKPSGWQTVKYDIVDGKYLYNRCHLIGFQLTGENANTKNLITGTRYMNVNGMLPFENMVADYVKDTQNHVLYRVTPVFEGKNLLSAGVLIEAYSVEDGGEGIEFCVFCYNNQPGITIDYADGDSALLETAESEAVSAASGQFYVLNTNTKKFHYPHCASAKKILESNRLERIATREQLIAEGYSPCGNCDP